MHERAEKALEDPHARLELELIDEFLKSHGSDLSTLNSKPESERRALLIQATRYADGRLAEIDARAAYVDQIHASTKRE